MRNPKVLNETMNVLNKYDVAGLYDLTLQQDEYMQEASSILSFMYNDMQLELEQFIINIFELYLEIKLDDDTAKRMADDVIELYKKY